MIVLASEQAIRAFVGQCARSLPLTIDQPMIDGFAELTGDRQWIHVDTARSAAESPFGVTIAHGLLTLALLPAWYDQAVSFPNQKIGVNYGFDRVRFVRPVPSNASLFGRFTLARIEEAKLGQIRMTWDTEIVEASALEQPVLVARWLTQAGH